MRSRKSYLLVEIARGIWRGGARLGATAAASALLAGAAPPAPQWSLTQKSDPITDARSATLMLKQNPIMLQLECNKADSRPFSVMVGTSSYIGGRPIARSAIVRFDEGEPLSSQWGHSSNFALLLADQRAFITWLSRSQKVAVRLTGAGGAPVDLVFDVTGAAAQVSRFQSTCRSLGIS